MTVTNDELDEMRRSEWLTDEQVQAYLDLGPDSFRRELSRRQIKRRYMVRASELFAEYPQPRTRGDGVGRPRRRRDEQQEE